MRIIAVLCCIFILMLLIFCCTENNVSSLNHKYMLETNFSNLNNEGYVVGDYNKIYFRTYQDNGYKIISTDYNGNKKTVLRDVDGLFLNIYNDNLYYIDMSGQGYGGNICRMNLDGSDNQVLSKHRATYLAFYNGKLYYKAEANGNNNCLWSMSVDGNDPQLLINKNILKVYFYENTVFYTTFENEYQVMWRCQIDGTNQEEILRGAFRSSTINNFFVYDGYIYYINMTEIVKVNILTKEIERVEKCSAIPDTLCLGKDTLYFVNMDIWKTVGINLKNGKKWYGKPKSVCHNLHIIGNRLYGFKDEIMYAIN